MNSKSGNRHILTILGTTASGKTTLAANLAALLNAEIISADSRQVYRGMDIGTGKDITEFNVHGFQVPYHLIDIAEPGTEFNVFEYQKAFYKAFDEISERDKLTIMCGGSGMYIEAILKGYKLLEVPDNLELRLRLSKLENWELIDVLKTYRKVHNTTDAEDKQRTIRAIEIEDYYQKNPDLANLYPPIPSLIFGIQYDRFEIRDRITARLQERLGNGMIEEVDGLLKSGLSPESLDFYGLEYRYITKYLTEDITYTEMFQQLNTAIHQFAKRQETWWRRMEKHGTTIYWINGKLNLEQRMQFVLQKVNQLF